MNKLSLSILTIALFCLFTVCKKDEDKISEKEILLTNNTWNTTSLLADGVEAGGPGETLYEFAGETVFNPDGTGNLGDYAGTWELSGDETQIIITTDELPFNLIVDIVELTENTMTLTTAFPDLSTTPPTIIDIEITFVSI